MHTRANATESHTHTFTIRRLSSIPKKTLDWLWQPRIPRGKITLLTGHPGSGKTSLSLDLAARLSRGQPLPTQSPASATPRGQTVIQYPDVPTTQPLILNSEFTHSEFPQATLLLSPDDNAADTLRPRLEAMNANLDQIHILPHFHSLIPDPHAAPDAPSPLELLDQALSLIPNIALLIIDPITHYLGLTDRLLSPHHDPTADGAESPPNRSLLHALSRLAEKHNIAILLTTRLTKKTDPALNPLSLQRTLGSLAFTSIARSILLLTPCPSQSPASTTPRSNVPSSTHEPSPHSEFTDSLILNSPTHLLLSIKSNNTSPPAPLSLTIAETLTYHAEHTFLPLASSKKPGPPDLVLQCAADFLKTALANGPLSAAELADEAATNSISRSTLTRARALLDVRAQKQDWSGRWYWNLPGDSRPLPENLTERRLAEMEKEFFAPSSSAALLDQFLNECREEGIDNFLNEDPADPVEDKEYPDDENEIPCQLPDAGDTGGRAELEHLRDFSHISTSEPEHLREIPSKTRIKPEHLRKSRKKTAPQAPAVSKEGKKGGGSDPSAVPKLNNE